MTLEINDFRQKINAILNNISLHSSSGQAEIDQCWNKLNQLQIEDQVKIEEINFKGEPSSLDQSVIISNRGGLTIDISGWQVQSDSPEQDYTFPDRTILFPGGKLKVGTSASQGEYSFGANQLVWNSRGGSVKLVDSNGQIISCLVYGNKAHQMITISHVCPEDDEYVEISNLSAQNVDLSGWYLQSMSSEHSFVFPEKTVLAPHTSFRVYTNTKSLMENDFSFNSSTAIWSKSSVCVLKDYLDGLVNEYSYAQ